MSDFIFATCRAGSEPALKREVASRHGDLLTPAFMRPQLITWKARSPLDDAFDLGAVFAAVSGRSLGTARTAAEVAAKCPCAGHIHVFPRLIPEDGLEPTAWEPLDQIRQELEPLISTGGDQVLDVIVGEEGEPWFLGTHRSSPFAHSAPGALPRTTLPPEAPSRAWLKMEQALAWLGLTDPASLAGRRVIELGCAPGGASFSLLQHGAEVIGVDTGEMSELVLSSTRFEHLRIPAGDFLRQPISGRIDIIVSDMNLEPNLVLDYVEALTQKFDPPLLILTLKINDAKVEAQLPALLKRVGRFGPAPVRAKQLPANRRDVCVIAGSLDPSAIAPRRV